jgi:exopolysaccharide production protein ExoQ
MSSRTRDRRPRAGEIVTERMIGRGRRRSHARSGSGERSWLHVSGPPGIDGIVITIALLLAAGTFIEPLYDTDFGRIALRVVWVLVYAACFVLLTRQHGSSWLPVLVRQQPLMLFVLALAFASALWSYDPTQTVRSALHLLGATLVGIFIGFHYRPSGLMRTLFWVSIVLLLLTFVSAMIAPEVAETKVGGATGWEGLLGNKNRLGSVTTIALIVFLAGTVGNRVERAWGLALTIFAVLVVVLAQAATSYVAAITGVGVVVWLVVAHRASLPLGVVILVLLAGIATAAYVSVTYIDVFTDLLGRDETLTKRTYVWQDALAIIAERPWLGHGLGVVWGLGEQSWLPDVETTSWAVHAHNGYLDLATELGLIAAAAAVLHLIVTLFNSFLLLNERQSSFALFAIAYVFAYAVMNLAENRFYENMQPEWMVFVAISVASARALGSHVSARHTAGTRRSGSRSRRKRRTSDARINHSASSGRQAGLRPDNDLSG